MTVLLLLSMLAGVAAVARPGAARAESNALTTAKLTPESAPLYIAMTLDTASDQWKKGDELLTSAGLRSLTDTLGNSVTSGVTGQSGQFNADLQPFLGGEVALVVSKVNVKIPGAGTLRSLTGGAASGSSAAATAEATGPKPSGIAAIVRPADAAAAWTKANELLKDQATKDGTTVTETTYNGVKIETAAGAGASAGTSGEATVSASGGGTPEAGAAEGGSSSSTAIARVDEYILVSGTATDLEPIIDTAKGKTKPLADLAAFKSVRKELRQDFLLFGFVNGAGVKALTGPSATSTSRLLTPIGGNLTSGDADTGLVLWADDPGLRIDTISIGANGKPLPAGGKNFESKLDQQVPGDTLFFVNGMDLGKGAFLNAIGLLLVEGINGQQVGGTPAAGVSAEDYAKQQYEQAARLLGFNLGTDFIQQMVGEYAVAISFSSLDPSGIKAILVSGVGDKQKLADAVSKLALLVQAGGRGRLTVTTKDVKGSQVQVVQGTVSGLPIQVEYGIVDGQFVLGYGQSLETYAAGGGTETLATNPQYKKVMATLPKDHSSILYIDVAQIAKTAQSLMTLLGSSASSSSATTRDASPKCGTYASQAEAQAAYDKDPLANADLDQNFNGKACEDFFGGGTPAAGGEATPRASLSSTDFSAIKAFATVGFEKDGMRGTSSILYIEKK